MAADRPWKAWVDALTPEQKQELHDQLDKKDRLTIDEMRIVYYLEGMNDGKVNALEELLGEDSNSAVITPYPGPAHDRKNS
jgi:hypothetical protein